MRLLGRLRTIGLQRRLARATLDSYAAWVEQFPRFCRRADGRERYILVPFPEKTLPNRWQIR